MPSTVLSSLVNIDALNAAYLMLKRQMDEKVYRTDIYPDEILGTVDLPYSQAYLSAINDNSNAWYITNEKAVFSDADVGNLNVNGNLISTGNATLGGNTIVSGTLDVTGSQTISGTLDVSGAATFAGATINGDLKVTGAIEADGDITGLRVWNAVWNDIADAITVEDQVIEFEPGFAYAYDGRKWFKTKDKKSPYFGIHSDTAGYILGYSKEKNQILIAIGGFVLAYVDKLYESGTYLTYTKDGWLTKAGRKDEKVAKFFRKETSTKIYNIDVKGRSWVKIL